MSDITYLDEIYPRLTEFDVNEEVIGRLANYVKVENFDTESMNIDLLIDHGNVESAVRDSKCVNSVKEIFRQATSTYKYHSVFLFFEKAVL